MRGAAQPTLSSSSSAAAGVTLWRFVWSGTSSSSSSTMARFFQLTDILLEGGFAVAWSGFTVGSSGRSVWSGRSGWRGWSGRERRHGDKLGDERGLRKSRKLEGEGRFLLRGMLSSALPTRRAMARAIACCAQRIGAHDGSEQIGEGVCSDTTRGFAVTLSVQNGLI